MTRRPARLRVIESRPLAGGAQHLVLERVAGEGFDVALRGGQFAILDTGTRTEDGRALRRCYSFLSPEDAAAPLELAVCEVGEGSRALRGRQPGQVLEASGPYGKLVAESVPSTGHLRILATDSGITAALGLVRGAGLRPHLQRVSLAWIERSDAPSLPEAFVRERLPARLASFERLAAEPIGTPGRARDALSTWLAEEHELGDGARWLVGDGDVVVPLEARLLALGCPPERLRVECFFHAPGQPRRVQRSAAGEVEAW